MRSSEGGNEGQEISAMINMLFCCLLKYNLKRTLSCFSASTTTVSIVPVLH